MKKHKVRGILAWILIFIMLIQTTVYAEGWKQDNSNWYYERNGVNQTGWVNDGTGWYHFDGNSKLQTGWFQENQVWYFLNTVHDGYYGRALTNQWAWIDGYCYSFDANGKMYANCVTPDGYEVNADGRWTVNGVVQFIQGKGIITTAPTSGNGKTSGSTTKGGGGSGGGGGGSHGGGSGGGGSHGGGSGGGGGSSSGGGQSGSDGDNTNSGGIVSADFPGTVFKNNVSIVEKLEFSVDQNANMVVISDSEAVKNWKKGEIYVLHDKNFPINDIAIKVTNIDITDTGSTVYYEQPRFEELVKSMDVSGSESKNGVLIPAEGVILTPKDNSRALMRSRIDKGNVELFKEYKITYNLNGIDLSGGICVNSIDYRLVTDSESALNGIKEADVVVNSTFHATAEYESKKDFELLIGKFYSLTPAGFLIGGEMFLRFDAEGKAVISVEIDNKTGIRYISDATPAIQPVFELQGGVNKITLDGSMNLRLAIEPTVAFLGVKLIVVGGEAGYGVEGEAKIFQSIPLVFCFDGRLFNICQFYADILPFNDESLLHYNHDFKGDTVDKQIHVEETGIVPECTRANSVYKGIIKNTEDKTPVAMAKIELLHEGVLIETIYSDTNGNFKGTKKKPGSYTLRVSAPYYNKWESQITIETGKETMLEIALKPQAVPKSTWTATVINAESSELIENAKLEITTLNNISLAEIYTDINGYASGLLPVGTYTVRISHPKYKARTETIEIEENKAAEFSWELTPASEETGGLMYGYLVCPNINGYNPETGVGRIPFGTIEFYDAYSQLISSVTADENGYYECDVPENCYSYKAYGEKCLKSESSDTPLFTTGGTYDFELKPKDFTSSLWLITSDKQTIRSAFVKITAVESDFYTKSESVYSKNYYFLDPFVFYLPIGTYQISVTDAYYAKENQIEYKAKDKEEIFTIQDNDGIFELKVTLEPTGNSYSVNNELNLSDETVLARPASPSNAVRVASPSNAAHSYDTDITLEDTDAKYKED